MIDDNYAAPLDHYGLRSTRINPGQSHENGVAEHAHYRLMDAIDQTPILRGSRDFDTTDDYASFVRQIVERRNRLVQGKLEQETLCLGSLPPAPVPEWRGERTDLEYVRILHLAATTMEATVDSALSSLLDAGKSFDYAAVRNPAERKPPEVPLLDPVRLARPESLRPPAPCQPGGGGAVRMTIADTSVMQERIHQLCHHFKLSTVAAEKVARFTAAGHGDALPTFLEVLEHEAEDRRYRRINRLRRESRLPTGKTWETFEHHRVPLPLRQQLDQLARGSFVERGVNVLAFGLPGTGKTHARCALGHRLVEAGHSVLFAPAYRLVQELLAAKRDLDLPHRLRKLNNFDFLLLDDLGYLPQGAEESEVLFTLIAERYERRSLGITSNLVFSESERIFANPMATAATIDRVVHHSVILEFDVPSYRTNAAQQRAQAEEVNRQN